MIRTTFHEEVMMRLLATGAHNIEAILRDGIQVIKHWMSTKNMQIKATRKEALSIQGMVWVWEAETKTEHTELEVPPTKTLLK